jgi:hypothetical protein
MDEPAIIALSISHQQSNYPDSPIMVLRTMYKVKSKSGAGMNNHIPTDNILFSLSTKNSVHSTFSR